MDTDPDRLRTVSDLAHAIASQRPGAVEAAVARSIRDVIVRRGIEPSSHAGSGRNAAALFDEAAACRALIVVELSRIGLSGGVLIGARQCMNNRHGQDHYGPKEGPKRLRDDRLVPIIAHLRDGAAWYFHLYLVPEYFGIPGNVIGGAFSQSTDGAAPHPFASTITVQLLPVLGPLVQGLKA